MDPDLVTVIVVATLGLFFFVCVGGTILSGMLKSRREARVLTFDVWLNSNREWRQFNPYLYLDRLDEESVTSALDSLYGERPPKTSLRVRWQYTTPSGRDYYRDEQIYSPDEQLRNRLLRARAARGEGRTRISALNSSFSDALREGHDPDPSIPKIYGYRIHNSPGHEGQIKVGYAKDSALKRIEQQFKTAAHLDANYEVLFILPALRLSGESFMDHDVHRVLRRMGAENPRGEWYRCEQWMAEAAVKAVQEDSELSR